MLHDGDDISWATGSYRVGDTLITVEGREQWEQDVEMILFTWGLKEHISEWPFAPEVDDFAAELRAHGTKTKPDVDEDELREVAREAEEFAREYVEKRYADDELTFEIQSGAWVIGPGHECAGIDEFCSFEPDPKNKYGLTDEQLEALRGGADWSTAKEME